MATEKQIMMRINATKNISKITQSMKMVSAAKLRGDQARLDKAQPFNVSCLGGTVFAVQVEFELHCGLAVMVREQVLVNTNMCGRVSERCAVHWMTMMCVLDFKLPGSNYWIIYK